jgi:hypothetical protein
MKIEPRNYTQGPQAIYKNGTYRVIANYPEKREAKLILNGVTKNISYNELFEVLSESEANSNDECFMPRLIRGSKKDISMHTWGIAVDLNPTQNPLGLTRTQAIHRGLKPFSELFQQTARDSGLIVGYDFGRCDGMHFEMSKFPA